jgi:hypothetical protein
MGFIVLPENDVSAFALLIINAQISMLQVYMLSSVEVSLGFFKIVV